MAKPRVVLADDHALVAAAFRTLLADHCDVVGVVSDGPDLLRAVSELHPDVAVIDVAMPLLNGVDATRQIKKLHPNVGVIILTANENEDLAAEAFRAGASSYVLKRCAASELLTAIGETMRRRSYVTPLVTAGLLESMARPKAETERTLTARQREVVQLIAEGRSIKEVAALLNISPSTANFHKYHVMQQLRLKNTVDLVRYAVRNHIV